MRALIAEDDSISRRMLEAFMVKWGYEILVAREGAEAWDILQAKDAPRLAILDWMMPGRDGIEICRSLRQDKTRPYVYVILLTARGQKEDMVAGLDAGADDYVTKPFDPFELRARLRAGRRIVELQEQLVQAREALRDQASRDPLTGLWNHKSIIGILRQEVARAARSEAPLAVAMIDVDKFKTINDTHGHPAGDAVLREASRRLRASMRDYDSIGRYGGDEFMAVIPGFYPEGVARFTQNFHSRLGRNGIETSEGIIPITLSVGLAALKDVHDMKAATLVRIADAALYRAKAAGRNRVAVASAQDIEMEIVKNIQDREEQEPEDPELALLPTLYPII